MSAFIKALIRRWLGDAGLALMDTLRDPAVADAFNQALRLAQMYVVKLAGQTSLDGDAKKAAAATAIKKDLASAGTTLANHLVNKAIEDALAAALARGTIPAEA